MTDPRRAQIERVLRTHGVLTEGDTANLSSPVTRRTWYAREPYAALLDALLALWPRPDREALRRHLAETVYVNSLTYAETNALARWLMTWATGTPSTPTWCAHIRRVEGDGDWALYCGAEAALPEQQPQRCWVSADWTQCPICHTKRPEEDPA